MGGLQPHYFWKRCPEKLKIVFAGEIAVIPGVFINHFSQSFYRVQIRATGGQVVKSQPLTLSSYPHGDSLHRRGQQPLSSNLPDGHQRNSSP